MNDDTSQTGSISARKPSFAENHRPSLVLTVGTETKIKVDRPQVVAHKGRKMLTAAWWKYDSPTEQGRPGQSYSFTTSATDTVVVNRTRMGRSEID
jgi:hypothetical protein